MTIATGNERADFVDNQVVPTSDRQIVVDYAAAEQRDLGNAIIADQADSDGTGVVLGQPVALLDAGSAGERVLSIVGTSPHPAVGWWGRRLANLNPSATNPGLEDVPFEDDETNVYQVGLRHNLIPTGVTALLDSTYVYHRHKHALGEQVTPAAVVINGSTLEIELPANNNFHPWADAGATRKVTVWLVAPETADPNYAVWTGDATSDGSTIDIVVPHHFGQGSASETEADYVVHVHGLSINRADDLRDDADANGLQRYLVLCDYDSAGDTYDYSQQVAVDSLQKLVAKVDAIPSFDSAIRAGAYIGTPQVTREWGYPSGWTVDDTTDPLTITIPDWSSAADHFVVTGDIANGLAPRLCASAGSLVASFAAALPAARYALLLVAVPDGITPNIYTTEYLVTNEAALTGDQLRRCLQIAAFDYDGSQPSLSRVTNISWVDLNTRRGWLDPRALGSGTGALGLEVEEVNAALNNGTLFKVMARLLPATATDHTFGEAFRVERASNTNTRAQVGKGAALADGESADIALGDPATDYLWRAARSGSARTLVGGSAGAEWFRHERASGGAASGGSGRAMVEDLHLLGYKQVIVHDPIHGARGSLRSQGGTHRVLASDLTLGVTTSAFATALSDATLNLEGQVLRVGDVLRVTMLAECHDYTTPTTLWRLDSMLVA
jgi:hypothetical protein